MSLLEKLTLDDLDADQRQLAECIGLEAYIRLLKNYAGSNVYIRMPDKITLSLRNEEIRKKFNGYNYRQLSAAYNLSEVTIRQIVAPIRVAVKAAPLPGQTSFFDDDAKI